MSLEQWLLSVIAPGGILAALVSLLGVILAKRQDKETKKAKAEVAKQSSAAESVANDARQVSIELEARIKDLETREKEAQRNFRNMEMLRAQYKKLDQRAYELEGQNKAQAQEMVEMREHGKRQDRALKALEDTNAEQKEAMAILQEQVAVFQIYIDAVDALFSSTPDDATVGSIRPKLPVKPDMKKIAPGPAAGARSKRGVVNGEAHHEHDAV